MKRLWITAFLLICLGLFSACHPKENAGEESPSIVVGFSQLGAESSWRIANTASMEQAARNYGYGLMMDNANQKQEKQIAAIRSFIAYRVDVIVFSPLWRPAGTTSCGKPGQRASR